MTSFRKLMRDSTEERRALRSRNSPAGTGYLFCNRHQHRFAITAGCPVCSPRRVVRRVR
jgi:nitrite reductase/ring-hydroxylating ferredoxin subunit